MEIFKRLNESLNAIGGTNNTAICCIKTSNPVANIEYRWTMHEQRATARAATGTAGYTSRS